MDTTELSPQEEQQEETENPEEKEKKPLDPKALLDDVLDIVETVIFYGFVLLMVFSYLLRPVTVEGHSMVPTLHDGDRLVMYRLFYQPKYGDVVVVNNRSGHLLLDGEVVESGSSLDECLIKRVIATEGQELNIDFVNGEVYIDGVLLNESYINDRTLLNDGAFSYPITIPKGYVFVMGDNRNHSTDSRNARVGLVKKDDILGTTFYRFGLGVDKETGESLGTLGFIE
ncbi:MAG: signal peptidase I [Oscillospiraceae bacterium]